PTCQDGGFPRRWSRGRIETSGRTRSRCGTRVSPGGGAGGGLKLEQLALLLGGRRGFPRRGSRGGGGKSRRKRRAIARGSFPGRWSRGRIETWWITLAIKNTSSFPPAVEPGAD